MPPASTTDRLARATEDLVEIPQQPHPATPFLQQGTIVNDTMKQLTKIFPPPNRNETAMAAPSPRVLETGTSAPRVDENNNNNNKNNQPPRVVDTTTTPTVDRLRNRVRTNPVPNQPPIEITTRSVKNSGRSRHARTNSVQKLQTCSE
jgi:hypothetical protein